LHLGHIREACARVVIAENPDEKAVMKDHIRAADLYSTETLIGVTREEALKLVE
jgi:hypothetical protein